MAKEQFLTVEGLFNIVAPIHVYLKADLQYEKEAKNAFRQLKKVRNHALVVSYFGEDVETLKERSLNKVNMYAFWKVYDELFKEIVKEAFPGLEETYDYYGAKCFNWKGRKLLAGDVCDGFPFYMDVQALKERLVDLPEEMEEAIS